MYVTNSLIVDHSNPGAEDYRNDNVWWLFSDVYTKWLYVFLTTNRCSIQSRFITCCIFLGPENSTDICTTKRNNTAGLPPKWYSNTMIFTYRGFVFWYPASTEVKPQRIIKGNIWTESSLMYLQRNMKKKTCRRTYLRLQSEKRKYCKYGNHEHDEISC